MTMTKSKTYLKLMFVYHDLSLVTFIQYNIMNIGKWYTILIRRSKRDTNSQHPILTATCLESESLFLFSINLFCEFFYVIKATSYNQHKSIMLDFGTSKIS